MCKYLKINKCLINNSSCPYVYFCRKLGIWKESKNMPNKCKIKENFEIPDGYYLVRMERKGYLYVDILDQTYKILNPFDHIPKYVKAKKNRKGEWRIRE